MVKFYFRPHIPLPEVMRPPSPWNVPLTRSSGLHCDDTGPKVKLRFLSVGMKIAPPIKIAAVPQPLNFCANSAGLCYQILDVPVDSDLEPENEPESLSNDPPAVPGLPVCKGRLVAEQAGQA